MTRLDKQTKDAKKPEAAQGATAEEGGAEVMCVPGRGFIADVRLFSCLGVFC